MNKKIIITLAAGIIVLGLVIGLIFCPFKKPKTMTRSQIAEYRQRLRDILNQTEGEYERPEDEYERLKALKELAKEVGAGYVHTKFVGSDTVKIGSQTVTTTYQNPISEAEIVLNINNALQTEMMIDICEIAARNYHIAAIATLAASFSAFVAWRATYVKK